MKTAVFIDGGFFLKRFPYVYSKYNKYDPQIVAKVIFTHAIRHIDRPWKNNLYRIFFYDCSPSSKKVCLPISRKTIDLAKSDMAKFRIQMYEELKRKRKVALRLGRLDDSYPTWFPKKSVMRQLISKKIKFDDLKDDNFELDVRQKQIDMMIGVDIASVSYKQQVERIILVSGDSDFVPAAKLARREGIDFILDPMWNNIEPDLIEHIDGLKSVCPKPLKP